MAHARAHQLLREGIALARSPEGREQGRRCLSEAVALDASCEAAWLWLAGLAEAPDEALHALERVLALNPGHEKARVAARAARLQAGISAARAQDRPRACALLRQATTDDPADEMAWLWLATVAEKAEGVACLERVLQLNPGNERARASLDRYLSQATARPLPSAPTSIALASACPFCQAPAQEEPQSCATCGALLVLTPVSAFETRTSAEQGPLIAFIADFEATDSQKDFVACYQLALAQLNLRRFEAARAALTQALLLKPDNEAVRTAVEELTRVCEEKTHEPASGPRRTVLVVDDCPSIRRLVSLTLEARGFEVRTAGDGYEAVDVLRDQGVPDLVLLDIVMPGLDGYQLCKLLRQNPDTARLPIVMISGQDGFFSKMRGHMAGVTEYLTKPFESQGLVRIVERYCPQVAATPSQA